MLTAGFGWRLTDCRLTNAWRKSARKGYTQRESRCRCTEVQVPGVWEENRERDFVQRYLSDFSAVRCLLPYLALHRQLVPLSESHSPEQTVPNDSLFTPEQQKPIDDDAVPSFFLFDPSFFAFFHVSSLSCLSPLTLIWKRVVFLFFGRKFQDPLFFFLPLSLHLVCLPCLAFPRLLFPPTVLSSCRWWDVSSCLTWSLFLFPTYRSRKRQEREPTHTERFQDTNINAKTVREVE